MKYNEELLLKALLALARSIQNDIERGVYSDETLLAAEQLEFITNSLLINEE